MADTARKITAESLHARLPVGEVARFDEQLVSRFHLLHEETGELATPPVFVAFDCLWCRGRDLRGLPLGERRVALERVISDGPLILPARRLAFDGLNAWQQVLERGYEGLVAKDAQSRYAGGPSTRWLKVKVRHE